MRPRTSLNLLIIAMITVLFLSSCFKREKKEDINYQTLAEDASITDNIYNDIFETVDEESKSGQYSNEVGKTTFTYTSVVDTCAVITLNTNGGNFPMMLEIDFGSGCTDNHNVTRKGKILLEYSAPYRDSGSVVSVSLQNYSVTIANNEYDVDGNKTITNNGRNSNGNLSYSVSVTNGRITKPDGGVITWESERVNEWTEGEGTTFWTNGISGICDDTYSISGYGQGTTSDGQSYRIESVTPLKKEICCYWITEGVLSYEVNGNEVATVDYGTGSCDWSANLNYNNNTYVIVIQ